jgi:heptosyltransferase III
MNMIIHHGALGDFVATFPLLRTLAPTPTLVVATWSKANLAEQLFDHVEAVHCEHPDFNQLFSVQGFRHITPLRKQRFCEIEHIYSFVSNGRDCWAKNMQNLVAPLAKMYYIDPRPGPEFTGAVWKHHQIQLDQQDFVGSIGDHLAGASRAKDGPVVIHPGSGGASKCWPLDRFEKVIRALQERGIAVRVILGEVEMDRWPKDEIVKWQAGFDVTLCDSLESLCELIQQASLFIGNDSGPAHLAGQLGVKTLALFGPSRADHWSPIGRDVHILAPPSTPCENMDWLTVQDVMDQLVDMQMC